MNHRNQCVAALSLVVAMTVAGCNDDRTTETVTTTPEGPAARTPPVSQTGPMMPATPVPAPPTAAPVAGNIEGQRALMDKDGDDRVTPEEHAAGASVMFTTMDADDDGSVTAAEMDASETALGANKRMASADKIKVVDSNGDGMISTDEHADASRSMFEMMDSDRDGDMSAAELKAGHDKMMATEKK